MCYSYFFFPNAKIVGANINPFQMKFKSKRIDELYIDVSSKKIINNFSNHIHEDFDIIIKLNFCTLEIYN